MEAPNYKGILPTFIILGMLMTLLVIGLIWASIKFVKLNSIDNDVIRVNEPIEPELEISVKPFDNVIDTVYIYRIE